MLTDLYGVRFLAPGLTTRLPLPLPRAWPDAMAKPVFNYRELYAVSAFHNPEWSQSQHLHGGFDGSGDADSPAVALDGGTPLVYANPPGGVHTAFKVVPESLRARHPEWFGGNQLCWLAKGLTEHLIHRAREILNAQKGATVISISQADNMEPCTKGQDGIVAKKEGSQMAPLLRTVNAIAAALEKTHPGVLIDTLAYQHTQRPPLHTRPHHNVLIRLCTIFVDFSRPIDDPAAAKENQDLAADLRAWAAMRDARPVGHRFQLLIWDYGVNFRHWLVPWPNWDALAGNLRLFAEMGVDGVFVEGNYKTTGGDLEPLKSYLYAQLLWRPYADAEQITREFLRSYYGAAAPHIGEYMKVLGDSARAKTQRMDIFSHVQPDANGGGGASYLDPDTTLAAAAHLQAGVDAVAGSEPWAQRARIASLSPLYVLLLRWQELWDHCEAAATCAWPLPPALGKRGAALAYFEQVYKEAGMHEAFPPERRTPDPTDDRGLGEGGSGLSWLRNTLKDGYDLERQPPLHHGAFAHGPYSPASAHAPARRHARHSSQRLR